MRRSSSTLASLLVLAPVIALVAAAWLANSDSIHTRVIAAVRTGKVHVEYADRLMDLATPFVKETRYEGKLNTTAAPKAGNLNLYVVDAKAAALPALMCNCGYVGDAIILCDKAFLDSFSTSIDYNVKDEGVADLLRKVDTIHNRWLASWLVGHEIGHAVLHDKQGEFSSQLAAGRRVTAQQEDEADAFFAGHVPPDERKRATFVLTNFAFQAFSLTYVSAPPDTGMAVIKPSADSIHAPWLLRALMVARTVAELDQGPGSGEQFYGTLAHKIRIDRTGRDVGTFCSAESLREQAAAKYRPR